MSSHPAYYHQEHYGYRLRGQHITRVEGFSDAVFAIAITPLIFANSVPDSYTLIRESMRDIVPFGLFLALLVSLWYAHFSFYIRYGLEEARMVALNALFLLLSMYFL